MIGKEFVHLHPQKYGPINLFPHSKEFLAMARQKMTNSVMNPRMRSGQGFCNIPVQSTLLIYNSVNLFSLSHSTSSELKIQCTQSLEETVLQFLLKLRTPGMFPITQHLQRCWQNETSYMPLVLKASHTPHTPKSFIFLPLTHNRLVSISSRSLAGFESLQQSSERTSTFILGSS